TESDRRITHRTQARGARTSCRRTLSLRTAGDRSSARPQLGRLDARTEPIPVGGLQHRLPASRRRGSCQGALQCVFFVAQIGLSWLDRIRTSLMTRLAAFVILGAFAAGNAVSVEQVLGPDEIGISAPARITYSLDARPKPQRLDFDFCAGDSRAWINDYGAFQL